MAKSPRASKPSQGTRSPPTLPALCAQPPLKPVDIPAGVSPARASAIRIGAKKWVNGTVLHYCFLDRAQAPRWQWADAQKDVVRWAAGKWENLGIGLKFAEVADASEAEIVIGCLQGNGSWSLVGTDNLDLSFRDMGRTLNYGWDLTTDWGRATALHELGHAIGFSHEHQSPKAGITWNEQAVYEYFSAPPNSWGKAQIDSNILHKLDPADVEGSTWDPSSIMEYPFQPGLIVSPKPYDTDGIGQNMDLSEGDKSWVRTWYPPLAAAQPINVMQLQPLAAAAGQQRDFEFVPTETRKYTVTTVGESDCRVVIFEVREGEPRHLTADDDSGLPSNAKISVQLVKGREYLIRARLNFVTSPAGAGLLVY